jgi:nucleoside-diphosphate-sugar epimerase
MFVLELDKAAYAAQTNPMNSHINVGSGTEISIGDLARLVARVTGFTGKIAFDATKPGGTPRKLLDTSRLNQMGWSAQIGLEEGVRNTYAWYRDALASQVGLRRG